MFPRTLADAGKRRKLTKKWTKMRTPSTIKLLKSGTIFTNCIYSTDFGIKIRRGIVKTRTINTICKINTSFGKMGP